MELSSGQSAIKIKELESRLDEYEQLIEAIKAGEVDAFALSKNNHSEIFTLQSGDYAYRMLVETFGEGALNISDEGLIVYSNNYFPALINLPYESVIGKSFFQFIHTDSRESFYELFKTGLAGQSKGEINLSVHDKTIPVYVSLTSLYPTLPTVGLIVTDLTEKKKQELINARNKELEIEKRLIEESSKSIRQVMEFDEAVMRNMGEGLYTVNDKGIVTSMNPAAEYFLGWKKEELIGKNMHEMTHHKHRDGSAFPSGDCAGFQVLKTGKAITNFEDAFIKKDGTFIDVMYSSSPIIKDGITQGLIVVFRDITEMKKAQAELNENREQLKQLSISLEEKVTARTAELKASEEKFYTLFNLSPICKTLSETPSGKIIMVNDAFTKTFGYNRAETINKSSVELGMLTPHVREMLINELKSNGRIIDIEAEFVKKSGETFCAIVSADIIKIGNKQYFLGAYHDISDRKKAEMNVALKNRELEKMNKELQSFAYISSHDLQEPLRKIQTFATRIAEKEENNLSENGKDNFKRMQEAAKRMQTLINDLLSYSRTNTAERKFETTDLRKIIEEVKDDLKEEIKEKHAIVEATELCEANIIPFQFRQLIHNLIGNSLKFSNPQSPPHIIIKSRIAEGIKFSNPTLSPRDKYCHISITDNGIGFEQQYSEIIFEVFQRLHGKTEYDGTGIGLSIVKKIVENHNGIITASSELRKGASFDIYIPAT